MKKLFLLLFFGILAHPGPILSKVCQSTVYPSLFYDDKLFPEGPSTLHPSIKNDIIIAFDLNDVVFSADYLRGLQEIKKTCQEIGLISSLDRLATVSKFLLYKLYLNLTKHPRARAWDGYFELLIEQGKTEKEQELIRSTRKFIQTINNIQIEVVELIQELQKQNHTIPALTNMGADFIKDQKEILEKQHSNPLLPAYHKQIIATVLELLSHPGSTMPCAENNWIVKPDSKIYEEFIERNDPTAISTIVFVDDKPKNVRAAVASGIPIGIVFSNSQALKKDLIRLGLLPKDPDA